MTKEQKDRLDYLDRWLTAAYIPYIRMRSISELRVRIEKTNPEAFKKWLEWRKLDDMWRKENG